MHQTNSDSHSKWIVEEIHLLNENQEERPYLYHTRAAELRAKGGDTAQSVPSSHAATTTVRGFYLDLLSSATTDKCQTWIKPPCVISYFKGKEYDPENCFMLHIWHAKSC
eukprot:scaffold196635_cov57-Attheya_sp.AAC.2